MDESDRIGTSALLEALGYSLAYRQDGWFECLVARADERWIGRGADRAGALADAVARMFPSRAARLLLQERLAASSAAAAPAASDDLPPRAEPQTEVNGGNGSPPVEPPPEPSAPVEEASAQMEHDATPDLVLVRPAPRPVPAAEPACDVEGVLEEIAAILEETRDARAELALFAPELQRLYLLEWISYGRALEDYALHDVRVVHAVGDLARSCSELAHLWYPGSVIALKRDKRPADTAAELGLPPPERPHTWREVAKYAAGALERYFDEAGADLDEYGWADGDRLAPDHPHPDALLGELRAAIEGAIDPLEGRPKDAPLYSDAALARLVDPARRLRWIRLSNTNPELWGALVGHLRWVLGDARKRPAGYGRALREVLDARHRPSASWAHLLRRDVEAKQRSRMRRDLARACPSASPGRPRADELFAWLVKAVHWFSSLELAELVQRDSDMVLALDETRAADRRQRVLLRRLKAQLAGEPSRDDGADGESSAEEREEEAAHAQGAPAHDPYQELRALVRERTLGRRALFVSNRQDPALRHRLEDELGLTITWCQLADRRLQAQAGSIAAGTYELVLAATGFLSHTADAMLARAARGAGVPYVRVFRGRPLACVRAIARELGLIHTAEPR
jgi:hypothetical protein